MPGRDISTPDLFPGAEEAALLDRAGEELRRAVSQNARKAGDLVVELFGRGGPLFFPAFQALAADPDPRVRRTLARSLGKAADARDPFRAGLLFSLLACFLWDEDPQIRAQARRVLREKLLPTYPEEGLEALAQWAAEPDPQKKILAAQYLPSLPENMVKRALILLRNLGRAEDEGVRRAVLRALTAWKNRAPQVVELELTRWEKDPALLALARRLDGGSSAAQDQQEDFPPRPKPGSAKGGPTPAARPQGQGSPRPPGSPRR